MRYNGNELKHMAIACQNTCAKEGILNLREKDGKLWNKTDVLTERWCRLVDNMLFYFKTRDANSDPYGLFLLEGSHVRPAENDYTSGCDFILEFDGDNRSTYFLARDATEAKEWIEALESVSYTKLKEKYENLTLRKDIDAGISATPRKVLPKNYSSLKSVKGEKSVLSPRDSFCPVLEMSLSCTNLNVVRVIDNKRLLQIKVYSKLPDVDDCQLVCQTEPVKASMSVDFLVTISFYQWQLMTPQTLLKYSLCQIKENGNVDTLGCVICPVLDFLGPEGPSVLDIRNNDSVVGHLHISIIADHLSSRITSSSESQSSELTLSDDSAVTYVGSNEASGFGLSNFKSLCGQAVSRTYKFPTSSGSYVCVQEIMFESKLTFHIPLLYLKLLIHQETSHIGALNSIGHLTGQFDELRAKHIGERQSLIEKYQENVKNIVNHSRSSSYFKPSIEKGNKELEFVPTNLHLQRMKVERSDYISSTVLEGRDTNSSAFYDIVTVGAAAAHTLKFKQGGLLSLLSVPGRVKKGKEHILSTLTKQDGQSPEVTQLPSTIQSLHDQTKSTIDTLRMLFIAGKECGKVPAKTSIKSALSDVSQKVCTLISVMDDEGLCKMLQSMPGSNQVENAISPSFADAATDPISTKKWEEQKFSVKTTLAKLIRLVHLMLDTTEMPLADLDDQPPGTPVSFSYDECLEVISSLSIDLSEVINMSLQGHAVYTLRTATEPPMVTYRRDIAFAQVLASCVCGVVTKLCSLMTDVEYVSYVANYGILMHFESLLSTYKNEMGMLEDYVVAVYDLQKVVFCCEKAIMTEEKSAESFFPTLHGTRNALTVGINWDEASFNRLPEELKKGGLIKVVPVMFNIGINEEQTIAEKLGNSSLQDYINMHSFSKLSSFYESTKKYYTSRNMQTPRKAIIEDRLDNVRNAIHDKKYKNVEILHLSAEICRHLNGVRVTSCKSAKDRTGMSVTLEQAKILLQNHDLSKDMFHSAVNCMRRQGTRLQNTKKNVGVQKYAFTAVQLKTFPKQYRPPDGTYGKGDS